jgi:hypothetical protein
MYGNNLKKYENMVLRKPITFKPGTAAPARKTELKLPNLPPFPKKRSASPLRDRLAAAWQRLRKSPPQKKYNFNVRPKRKSSLRSRVMKKLGRRKSPSIPF